MKLAVETAKNAGVPVAVHTSTAEGMRRAILAGAETIEHGNDGTAETWKLMVEHHVALCPTLAAGDATTQYSGWKKGQPEPQGLVRKRASFKVAAGCRRTILSGSDVGVFPHGDNSREIELMVDYGMPTVDALKSATSIAGRVLHMDIGQVKQGMLADLIAVDGNPVSDISAIRKVTFVMKGGAVQKQQYIGGQHRSASQSCGACTYACRASRLVSMPSQGPLHRRSPNYLTVWKFDSLN